MTSHRDKIIKYLDRTIDVIACETPPDGSISYWSVFDNRDSATTVTFTDSGQIYSALTPAGINVAYSDPGKLDVVTKDIVNRARAARKES
jgi:hypothetical protein